MMAKQLEIAQLGNAVLRQTAQPIADIQENWVQDLIDNMMTTMVEASGVGIAAPQVGASYQLLIVASRPTLRYPHAPAMEPTAMINPRLVSHSDEVAKDWEGCLSVPGLRGEVPRYQQVAIEFTNRAGKLEQLTLSDFPARIFQHEFDHLNGLVFLDRLKSVQDLISDLEYHKRLVPVQG
jgi:peptide deformylase